MAGDPAPRGQSEAESQESRPEGEPDSIELRSEYAGPLPPPRMLADFERQVPGAAARILEMAELQARHRMDMERRALDIEGKRTYLGIAAGVLVTPGALAVAGVLVAAGHGGLGAAAAITPIAGLAGVFVYGSQSRRAERLEEMRLLVTGGRTGPEGP